MSLRQTKWIMKRIAEVCKMVNGYLSPGLQVETHVKVALKFSSDSLFSATKFNGARDELVVTTCL